MEATASHHDLVIPLRRSPTCVQFVSATPYSVESVPMRHYFQQLLEEEQQNKGKLRRNLKKLYEVFSPAKLESPEKSPERASLTDFPDQALTCVLSFLRPKEILSVALSCRYLHAVSLTHLHFVFISAYKGFPPGYMCTMRGLMSLQSRKPTVAGGNCQSLLKEFSFCISTRTMRNWFRRKRI